MELLSGGASTFTPWGGDAYANDIYRGAVDAIARNAAKLKGSHVIRYGDHSKIEGNCKLNRLLQVSPNPYMSGFDMLCFARQAGKPYDVILLDWKMPQLNGMETARLIRERYPEKIPILLLTAYDWSEIEREAMEIGIQYFMPKPFFMSTFKNAVSRIMGSANKKEEKDETGDVVRGKHILVVDDIEVNRIILVKILTTLGAVCDTAGNGQEAVDAFETSRPGQYDLILMDVQMPVLNGYGATRAIRASEHPSAKQIPIIAMTANAFVDDVRDAIETGMDAHVAKPVQIDNLKSTIREVLNNRSEQSGEHDTVSSM